MRTNPLGVIMPLVFLIICQRFGHYNLEMVIKVYISTYIIFVYIDIVLFRYLKLEYKSFAKGHEQI